VSRVLQLALLAYPRGTRQRDGAHLLALAEDLAQDHGTGREVLGLLRGGLADRWHRRRVPRVALAGGVVAGSLLLGLAWSAAADPLRWEDDQFSCTRGCGDVDARVADRERQGWTCTGPTAGATVTWRCTRD